MARRRSEGNMFLDSQESANISGNEKTRTGADPTIKEAAPAAKSAVRTEKPAAAAPKTQKPTVKEEEKPAVPSSVSDVMTLLSSTKETRQNGIAKSIYLDKDVHDRILTLSQQSGIPFSKIVNLLLKAAFEESEP